MFLYCESKQIFQPPFLSHSRPSSLLQPTKTLLSIDHTSFSKLMCAKKCHKNYIVFFKVFFSITMAMFCFVTCKKGQIFFPVLSKHASHFFITQSQTQTYQYTYICRFNVYFYIYIHKLIYKRFVFAKILKNTLKIKENKLPKSEMILLKS